MRARTSSSGTAEGITQWRAAGARGYESVSVQNEGGVHIAVAACWNRCSSSSSMRRRGSRSAACPSPLPCTRHAVQRRWDSQASLKAVAERCAERVIVPHGVGCCGWAGDRGFTVPELNAAALARLRDAIPEGCEGGYSTSRTCEIGLSEHSGIPYRSILYLVEKATRVLT